MNEVQASFEAKLKELVSMGRANKDILEVDKVNDFFKGFDLSGSQIDKIYEYLENSGIVVMTPIEEDEPSEEALLDMDQEDEALLEAVRTCSYRHSLFGDTDIVTISFNWTYNRRGTHKPEHEGSGEIHNIVPCSYSRS